jgi:hypothetical protein
VNSLDLDGDAGHMLESVSACAEAGYGPSGSYALARMGRRHWIDGLVRLRSGGRAMWGSAELLNDHLSVGGQDDVICPLLGG